MFFFFKQKTAYEIYQCDWSSDVCSSDLKAWKNVNYFREKVEEIGYSTLNSSTLIVPVLIGNEKNAVKATRELNKRKILAPNARFPAVALGQARLRFVMTTNHQREDIDYLLKALEEIKPILNI